jgi:hypothetical protein
MEHIDMDIISRVTEPGVTITSLRTTGWREYFLTAKPAVNEGSDIFFRRVADSLNKTDAHIVSQIVLGGSSAADIEQAMGPVQWPVTHVQGYEEQPLRGTQMWAVSAGQIRSLRVRGNIIGCVVEDDDCRYCTLGGLLPVSCQ